jgi:hypothetical protein
LNRKQCHYIKHREEKDDHIEYFRNGSKYEEGDLAGGFETEEVVEEQH